MATAREQSGRIWWVAGLRVWSNRPLAEQPQAQEDGWDVQILFSMAGPSRSEEGMTRAVEPGWIPLAGRGEASVRIRTDGRQARVESSVREEPGFSLQARRIAPFAAALQGKIVLHAGAVVCEGEVHALIGESGAGKSTLVAELGRQGLRPLTDDLLPVQLEGERVCIPAGIAGTSDPLMPLVGIHFLERTADLTNPRCWQLGSADLLRLLLRHGFGELRVPRVWALQFETYARIAELCPGFRLLLTQGRERVPATARFLREQHFSRLAGALDPDRDA